MDRVVQNSGIVRDKLLNDLETTIITKQKIEGEKKLKKMKVGLPKITTKHHLPNRLNKAKSVTKELSLDDPKVLKFSF